MKKRVLATVLAGTMAASLLTGCGAKVETTGSKESSAAEKTETVTETASEVSEADISADITLWTYPIGNGAMQKLLIL